MHILCALELRRGHDETATTMHYTCPFSPLAMKGSIETHGVPTDTPREHQLPESRECDVLLLCRRGDEP